MLLQSMGSIVLLELADIADTSPERFSCIKNGVLINAESAYYLNLQDIAGGAVPALAQLALSSSDHAAMSTSPLTPSQDDKKHQSTSSSTLDLCSWLRTEAQTNYPFSGGVIVQDSGAFLLGL
ncbi:uncharacterized protein LOC141592987 [Silene latifolia]|uniref:uncharacterized protein LOC141592987 n=1 Tax=Silene latifolia TaxID=37657 RepID=UPI003D787177